MKKLIIVTMFLLSGYMGYSQKDSAIVAQITKIANIQEQIYLVSDLIEYKIKQFDVEYNNGEYILLNAYSGKKFYSQDFLVSLFRNTILELGIYKMIGIPLLQEGYICMYFIAKNSPNISFLISVFEYNNDTDSCLVSSYIKIENQK